MIRLEEKERREKEVLKQIIKEADEYKAEYYKKWKLRCESSRTANREKEKVGFQVSVKPNYFLNLYAILIGCKMAWNTWS